MLLWECFGITAPSQSTRKSTIWKLTRNIFINFQHPIPGPYLTLILLVHIDRGLERLDRVVTNPLQIFQAPAQHVNRSHVPGRLYPEVHLVLRRVGHRVAAKVYVGTEKGIHLPWCWGQFSLIVTSILTICRWYSSARCPACGLRPRTQTSASFRRSSRHQRAAK